MTVTPKPVRFHIKRCKVVRTVVILGVLTLAIVTAPKGAESQRSRNAGPHLSPRQQVAEFQAIASIDRSDLDVCEAQRRFRAAMYRILTPRQRQEVIASGMAPARRRKVERLQERARATLRACQQTHSSCVEAKRAVNVVAVQSAFDPSAIKRCSHHVSTKASH